MKTYYDVSQVVKHFNAIRLHEALAKVDTAKIPVSILDRSIPRKELAKSARSLFKKLGLDGISVTAPSYSMASSVHISVPVRRDVRIVDDTYDRTCPAYIANAQAREKLEKILAVAFPNHNDRSDYQTDYFDSKWTIS